MKPYTIYKLDDGRELNIYEIMEITGISKKTTWQRLQKTRDIKELSKPTRAMLIEDSHTKNYFEDTYSDLSPELFKLLFGKWNK